MPEAAVNVGTRPLAGVVWQDAGGVVHEFSGAQMTNRVVEIAAVLHHLGVRPGDVVAGLMGRRPATLATAMATLRLGATYAPLVGAWGADVLAARLRETGAGWLVVDGGFRDLAGGLDADARVVVVSGAGREGDPVVNDLVKAGLDAPPVADVTPATRALLLHPLDGDGDGPAQEETHAFADEHAAFVTDVLRPDDDTLLFSTANPSAPYGVLTTGLVPLVHGVRRVMLAEEFSVVGWLACAQRTGATHLAAARKGLAQVVAAGPALPATLRVVVNGGEPLAPDERDWFAGRGVQVRELEGLSPAPRAR